MFCPACGSENSTDQRYCRKCGINLEPAAQSLLDHYPDSKGPDLERHERLLERFGRIAFGGLGIVVLIAIVGMIYSIFTKMILSGEKPLLGIMLSILILFAALSLVYVIFAEDLKEKKKKREPLHRRSCRNRRYAPPGNCLRKSHLSRYPLSPNTPRIFCPNAATGDDRDALNASPAPSRSGFRTSIS
jgi:hypothetical protein